MRIIDYDANLAEISAECNVEVLRKSELGYNGPMIVNVNGVNGFLKKSDNTTKTFDKFEYLLSKLGKYLNVKTADEYLVEEDGKLILFSKSVVNEGEELIMASGLPQELINTSKVTTEEVQTEARKVHEFKGSLQTISTNHGDEYKVDSDQIEYALGIFISMVKRLNVPNEEEIIKDYIKMAFFDSFIGNKDRNVNNFGLIKSKDGSYSFAPLFDSSTIEMPGIDSELCNVNGYIFNRKDLCKYLLNTYPQYMNEILDCNIELVGEKLSMMSQKILEENELEWFKASVLDKLNNNVFDIVKSQSF